MQQIDRTDSVLQIIRIRYQNIGMELLIGAATAAWHTIAIERKSAHAALAAADRVALGGLR